MNAPIDYALQIKRRNYITLLDQALAIAEELQKGLDAMDQILEEKFPSRLAA